eukprot:scaffold324246_cov47-Prasinocladus_malaysianus.AAC.1
MAAKRLDSIIISRSQLAHGSLTVPDSSSPDGCSGCLPGVQLIRCLPANSIANLAHHAVTWGRHCSPCRQQAAHQIQLTAGGGWTAVMALV